MMNRDIPGYFYDSEKKKYFKIEKGHAGPATAPYSAETVKRRKLHHAASQAERRRAHLVRNHIKRNALTQNVLCAGFSNRDLGLGVSPESGRGTLDHADLGAQAWASGVVDKGCLPFAPSFARARLANLPCFYVGAEDTKTGLGVAYATLDEETLVGSYIPTDGNDKVHFSRGEPRAFGTALSFRTEQIRCPQMSAIKYHRPSNKILLTSREPGYCCGLYCFSPPHSELDSNRPHWLLGETSHYQRLAITPRGRDEWLVNGVTPAPPSSDLICIVGTNDGLLRVHSNETISWVAPGNSPRGTGTGINKGRGKGKGKGVDLPQEIFAQDFQQDNSNVLFVGGRKPRLWTTDLRAPVSQWSYSKHMSSIAHLRSVNPHQVLVAGLRNSMALYDTRFFASKPDGTKPLLTFPEFRNDAYFHIGWDISLQLNVVAAAQDNGTVRLFSLSSGRRLRNLAVDAIHTDTPIKAMMFQQMPRERLPSLFIGEGPSIKKLSFGALEADEEA